MSIMLRRLALRGIFLAACGALACAARAAGPANPVVAGQARFTIITPYCARLEYSADGRFVDQPSIFAANRKARFGGFRLSRQGQATVIDTGAIHLVYTPNGQPFSASNLRADIQRGKVKANWTPGAPNPGNLGGTVRTLDQVVGPIDLGQGLLSRDGWYLLDDSRSQLLTADWVESRPRTAGTDWYLFGYGDDYRSALKSLAAIGGASPMPRRYTLGTWFSRFWPFSSSDYHQIIEQYRQHDFPLDNIVMDMDWHRDGWTGWSWNRKLLPDAEQLLPWFHSQGLHVTLNLHPADGVAPHEDQYPAFMRAMGADPASKQTIPFDAGSKKYMDALSSTVLEPLKKAGTDFWWLDWQQYAYTRSVPDLTNLFWLNTLLYQNTAQDGLRGVSFSRWAGWGDHRHPIQFSGDADTGFNMLAFEVPFTSTAGNVGCFFWSHDIGGHRGGRNEESYTRWVQFGAMSAALRSHSERDPATDRRPWNYPKWAEDSMRVSFHLRDTLFPYIYSSVSQTSRDTVPLNRPLYIDYPGVEEAYHNAQEFLLGDNLLVAPIVTPGVGPGRVAHQQVWFPGGSDWFNIFTGEQYAGGHSELVAADINEFPAYARGGVPMPMQPYTLRMATTPLSTLVVRCYPGEEGKTGRSALYEDDGETQAYTRGAYAVTPLSYLRRGGAVTVTIGAAKGTFAGQVANRALVIELPNTGKATAVIVNGKPAKSTYDAATMTNRVTVPARSAFAAATIVVKAPAASDEALRRAAAMRRFAGVLGSFTPKADASPRSMLNDALTQAPDEAQRNEVLAVAGIGVVRHNLAPYMYGGTVRDEFFAPAGSIDNDSVALATGSAKVTAGQPVVAAGATYMRRGRSINLPSPVVFSVGGKSIRQMTVPETALELLGPDNVAATARVTVSGVERGYGFEGAVDGVPGGYPGDKAQEWSAGSMAGAWLQLDWDAPQTVDRVMLFDRPNGNDQILSGELTFSDGTSEKFGTLPNDGLTPLVVSFPAKSAKWVRVTVTSMKSTSENAGLAEIAVMRAATATR